MNSRRFITTLSVIAIFVVLAYTALLNSIASASPQKLKVISRTRGNEVLTAELLDKQVRIKLKNNHKDTITAFAISVSDTTIKEDFAYSEVHFGIEAGDIFERSYAVSPTGSEPPPLYLLTVLLKNGTAEGIPKIAQEIKEERLGEKIQIYRMLKILEKEGFSDQDIKALKGEIIAALDAGEHEARVIRKELLQASAMDDNLSEDLKQGLHWGRAKLLRKFQTLEQLPTERQEGALIDLKDRANKLFAKL